MGITLYLTRPKQFQITWNDETLYYTVAKNIFHNGDFNSHHYLSESLLLKGYPTKDTHPPGYPLLIAASFLWSGPSEKAPLILNYILTVAIVVVLFLLGFRFQQVPAAIFSVILFLLHPLTLSHSHSMMSEIPAAFMVTLFFLLLASLREGWIKGFLLAAVIAMAALIKPFLLALIPATLVFLVLISDPGKGRTQISTLLFALIFYLLWVHPLSSNQEYYPSSINDLFLRPGIRGKLEYAFGNFARNIAQLRGLKFKDGEGGIVVLTLVMLLGAGGVILPLRRRMADKGASRLSALFISLITTFVITVLAVFFVYEFSGYRGSRAVYCFMPLLGFFFSVGLFKLRFKVGALLLALPVLWAFCYYFKIVHGVLEWSKLRQTSFIYGDFKRTDAVLREYRMKPKMLMSKGNLLLPARRFPTEVIISEPRTLRDFEKILKTVKPEVLELRANSPLFLENLKKSGNSDFFAKNYLLFHSGNNFYYYKATGN